MTSQPESRPIRFRAWDRNQMVLVHSLSWNDGGMIWHGPGNKMGWAWIDPTCASWSETHNPKPAAHDVCPVMQYTGFDDVNKVKIYEGDIVRYPEDHFGKVKVGQVVFLSEFGGFATRTGPTISDHHPVDQMQRIEVIGDVHSTPDLLKS